MTTAIAIHGIHTGIDYNDLFVGVWSMNTEIIADETMPCPLKSQTLKTLLQVICAEDEFALLRQTLRLYCEELSYLEE